MKSKHFFYVLVGGLVLILVFGAYGYAWGYSQLMKKKADTTAQQIAYEDSQKRIDQLIQLSRRYESAKARSNEIDRALPRASQQAEILLELKAAAAETGITVSGLQFTGAANPLKVETNQATPQKDIFILPISLRLSGNYTQLIGFLNRLDTLSRYNSVVSLSANKVQSNRESLDANLNLIAYLKP